MSAFRKKPVVIEAFRLPTTDEYPNPFFEWAERVGFTGYTSERDGALAIETLEGTMLAEPGDWIIRGVKGEFYPCKPDIFAATYEEDSPTWPYVLAFARLMERKLAANRHKGDRKGWLKDPPSALFKRLLEEVEELRAVFNRPWGQTTTAADDKRQLEDLMDEAADVGNFAMMLVDCCAWASELNGESGIIEAGARRAS